MSVFEISIFPASNALLGDENMLLPALKEFSKADGCLSVHYGINVHDEHRVGLIGAAWETYQQANAFMNCDSYTAVMESLKPTISGPVETLHIKCNTLPTTVFEAPITEVNVFKLKEAQNLDAFVKIVGDADQIMHLLKGCRTPTSWGESLPTPLIVSGLIGWDSIEDSAPLRTDEPFSKAWAEGMKLVDVTTYHVNFRKVNSA